MNDFFDEFNLLANQVIEHEIHPPLPILKKYLQNKLVFRVPDPDNIGEIFSGDVKGDWNGYAVASHILTCGKCSAKISELRNSNRPEEIWQSVKELLWPRFDRFQLAWTGAALIVCLGIGLIIGNNLPGQTTNFDQFVQRVDSITSRSGSSAFDSELVFFLAQWLQEHEDLLNDIDLTSRAQYSTEQGDTLASIANELYGDDRLWPLIYLVNHDYQLLSLALENSESKANAELPGGLNIKIFKRASR